MAQIGLIATDFDGTIFDADSYPRIAPDLVQWLRFAQGGGAKWAICSGRQWNEEFASELRPLKGNPLPDFLVTVEREINVRRGDGYVPLVDWNARCAADHEELFRRSLGLLEQLRDWIESRTGAEVYEDHWSPLNVIARNHKEADKIFRHVQQMIQGEVPEMLVVRNSVYFRLAHRRYTKGTAMEEIARRLGLKREAVFAAGDHYNDLTMLDGTHAGLVAAPSNAIDEVKETVQRAGGYVARQPFGLGVLEALQYYDSR